MVLLAFAAGGSSSERKRSRPIPAFSATPHDGQRRCRTLLKIPADSLAGIRLGSWESTRARLVSPAQASLPRSWPTPELRIPNAAAQTRVVSLAGIRLDSCKSVRSFKGIICVRVAEIHTRCRFLVSNGLGQWWIWARPLLPIDGPMTGGRVRSFGSYHTLHASLIRATLPGIFESVAMMGLP